MRNRWLDKRRFACLRMTTEQWEQDESTIRGLLTLGGFEVANVAKYGRWYIAAVRHDAFPWLVGNEDVPELHITMERSDDGKVRMADWHLTQQEEQ